MMLGASFRIVASALLPTQVAGCSKADRRDEPSPAGSELAEAPKRPPTMADNDASYTATDGSMSGTADSATAIPARGTATLVVERISNWVAWGGSIPDQYLSELGVDLFVIVRDDDSAKKSRKEYVFCPSQGPDGGTTSPRLSTYGRYCRAFASCHIVSPDAGASHRVEVQCGSEDVVLESDGTHTIVRGSFGEREVAAHPTTIAPVRTATRRVMNDG
jgi:hypothetical protein